MKLTLKRDLPLLLAALLVIWGLWYARPIGVDTLFPGLEPDLVYVTLIDFTGSGHEDQNLKLTAGTEEFDDLWSEIQELRFRRSPFNVVVQALPFLEAKSLLRHPVAKLPRMDCAADLGRAACFRAVADDTGNVGERVGHGVGDLLVAAAGQPCDSGACAAGSRYRAAVSGQAADAGLLVDGH